MSNLSQALQREKIAQKFHLVTEQIEAALSEIHYDKLNLSEEVREQVLLQPNLFWRELTAYNSAVVITLLISILKSK